MRLDFNTHFMEIKVSSESNRDYYLDYLLSEHVLRRMDQRAITKEMLKLSLLYGIAFFKQGLTFYCTRSKDLPNTIPYDLSERMNNMILVVDDNSSLILTAYRSTKGEIHIRKKYKERWKYAA